MRRRSFTISRCYCPECGNIMTVPRIRAREKNHHKDIWCPVCKKVQTMIEVRYCDCVRNLLGEVIA